MILYQSIEEGKIQYFESFFESPEQFIANLQKEIVFESESIMMFGKSVTVPRLIAWHGDQGIQYRYSGTDHLTKPWTPALLKMRQEIETRLNLKFNAVLLNYYRDGHDHMSWHSDDEKEMGIAPTIASVSLGEERIFEFKRKKETSAMLSVDLKSGSLLIMDGRLQNHFHHRLKKMPKRLGVRINLTFRLIHS